MTDLPVSSESRSGSLTALLRSMKKTKSKSFHRINKRHVVINELHLCKGVIHKVQIRTAFVVSLYRSGPHVFAKLALLKIVQGQGVQSS